jgi:hypothetical protein
VSTPYKAGEIVTITLTDVRVTDVADGWIDVELAAEREVTLRTDEGRIEITRHGEAKQSDRIAAVLTFLDSLEAETSIEPYVAAGVRRELGLPPRHWPPQPGDVWEDVWSEPWFARVCHSRNPSETVMVSGYSGGTKKPDELLTSTVAPTLVYRREGAPW